MRAQAGLFRCLVLLGVSLLVVGMRAAAADDAWVAQGRVLDDQGRPVVGAAVGTVWNANGLTLEEIHKRERDKSIRMLYALNEGRMEPMGSAPTQSGADGRFSIKMGLSNYFVLVLDKERKRQALGFVDPADASRSVDVKLVPLVRLHGRARIAATGKFPNDAFVMVRLPNSDKTPLFNRLVLCGSEQARFEFWLPPGSYEFEAGAWDDAGGHYEQLPYRPITLPAGKSDVDFGVLDLAAPQTRDDQNQGAGAKGSRGDVHYTKRYGQPAPRWHAVDTRGLPKNAQISDLKGKWVLVYFWNLGCDGCLARTLPGLAAFYEAHQADHARFEIVGICNEEPKIKTIADVDHELRHVIKTVWHGKPLPFPIVLDNTPRTAESFGVDAMGRKLLFDPAGRLVPGDEQTLVEKLKSPSLPH